MFKRHMIVKLLSVVLVFSLLVWVISPFKAFASDEPELFESLELSGDETIGSLVTTAPVRLSTLNIGDRVMDHSWEWEHRYGTNYRTHSVHPNEISPITWIVAAKDYYNNASTRGLVQGAHVTLLADDMIGAVAFCNRDYPEYYSSTGKNHWGLSGTGETDIYKLTAREFINHPTHSQILEHARITGFYEAMSPSFRSNILETNLANKDHTGNSYNTTDNVFLSSRNELYGTDGWAYFKMTNVYPYNHGEMARIFERIITRTPYVTPPPPEVTDHPEAYLYTFRSDGADGGYPLEWAGSTQATLMPALNLRSDTWVYKIQDVLHGEIHPYSVYGIIHDIPDSRQTTYTPADGHVMKAGDIRDIIVTVNDADGNSISLGGTEHDINVEICQNNGLSLVELPWIGSVNYDYSYGAANQVKIAVTGGPKGGSAHNLKIKAGPLPYMGITITDTYSIEVEGVPDLSNSSIITSDGDPSNLYLGLHQEETITIILKGMGDEDLDMGPGPDERSIILTKNSIPIEEYDSIESVEYSYNHGGIANAVQIKVRGGSVSGNINDITISTVTQNFTSVLTDDFNIYVLAGGAEDMMLDQQPSSEVSAGTAFLQHPVIHLIDPEGNLANRDSITEVQARIKSGPGELGGTTRKTASSGIVEFADLFLTATGQVILEFEAVIGGQIVSLESQAITVSHGPAWEVKITGTDHATLPDTTVFSSFEIRAEIFDRYQNPAVDYSPSSLKLITDSLFLNNDGTKSSFVFTGPVTNGVLASFEVTLAKTGESITIWADPDIYAGPASSNAFKVTGATPEIITLPQASAITYGDDLSRSTLIGGLASVPGRFEFSDRDHVPDEANDEYQILVVFIPDDIDNYSSVETLMGILVNKKELLVTADNRTKTYTGTVYDKDLSVSYSGFVRDDDKTVLTGSLTYIGQWVDATDAGEYSIIPQGLLADNYDITFIEGKLFINRADLTIKAKDESKVYGDEEPDYSYLVTAGTLFGDDILIGEYDREPGEAAGTYEIDPAGLVNDNYNINYQKGTLSITKKDLNVTADNKYKLHGTQDPEFTVSYSDFAFGENSDVLSGVLQFEREPGEDIGTYSITPFGLTSENYNIMFVSGSLLISTDSFTDIQNTEYITGSGDDIDITLTTGEGISFVDVTDNDGYLTQGLDYSLAGNVFTFFSSYFEGKEKGEIYLTFIMDKGAYPLVVVDIRLSDTDSVMADVDNLEIGFAPGDSNTHVTRPLSYLPVVGENKTTVSWHSSHRNNLSHDGKILNSPSYKEGDLEITLTAVVRRGDATTTREFILILKALAITNQDEVDLVAGALEIQFSGNDTYQSVTRDLFELPVFGLHDTSITWSSDRPETVSATGQVKRPSRKTGDQTVTLTALVYKGSAQTIKQFTLTVLADTIMPVIVSSFPENDSQDISRDTMITVTFSKEILEGDTFAGIQLKDENDQMIEADIKAEGSKVSISPKNSLFSNTKYHVIIPQGAVVDKSGNSFETQRIYYNGAFERIYVSAFSTQVNTDFLRVLKQYPDNDETNVSLNPGIEITFDDGILAGSGFSDIILSDSGGNIIDIKTDIEKNSLIISPLYSLSGNSGYTVFIPANALKNTSGKGLLDDIDIYFVTGTSQITSNPQNKENNVAVNINEIEVTFESVMTSGDNYNGIVIKDAAGNVVPVTSRIAGGTLYIKPQDDLDLGTMYTVEVPEGALKDSEGNNNSRHVFRFETAPRIAEIPLRFNIEPIVHIYGDPVSFDASYVFDLINNRYNRTAASYLWDTGDGSSIEGHTIGHTYENTGDHTVTLSIVDDKGQIYTQEAIVSTQNPGDATMSVSPAGVMSLYMADEQENPGQVTYFVELEVNGVPLQNRLISVSGGAVITTNNRGRAEFTISQNDLESGTNLITFTHGDIVISRLIRLAEGRHSTLKIMFDDGAGEVEDLEVRVDGNRVFPEWNSALGVYVIEGIPMGQRAVSISSRYYYTQLLEIDLFKNEHFEQLSLIPDIPSEEPVILYIISGLSDTRKNRDDYIIQGVYLDITFTAVVDWKGHMPGTITFNAPDKKAVLETNNYTINARNLDIGRVYVQLESHFGNKSMVKDAAIAIAPQPPLGSVVYENGGYKFTFFSSLPGAETAGAPNYMPLIGGASIGFGKYGFKMDGKLHKNGDLVYILDTAWPGINTKVYSVRIAGSIDTNMLFRLNEQKNAWLLENGELGLYVYGWKSKSKPFVVGVVPCYLKGTIFLHVAAQLDIERQDQDLTYHGILGLYPSLEIAVGAGCDYFNVEGYLRGTVGPAFSFPGNTWAVDGKIVGGVRAKALVVSYDYKGLEYRWNNSGISTGPIAQQYITQDYMMQKEPVIDTPELTMISRDYLEKQSVWLPHQNTGMMAMQNDDNDAIIADVENITLQNAIFPNTQADMISVGDDVVMVWVDDNPMRTDMNHAELRYSVFDGSSWSYPEFINIEENNSLDFEPVLAKANSTYLLAWQDMNKQFNKGASLDEMLGAAEISVASTPDPKSGWSNYQVLTSDEYLDHSLNIASDGDTAILTWIKNRHNNYRGSESEPNEIYFSKWENGIWSQPELVGVVADSIISTSTAYNGNEGAVVFVKGHADPQYSYTREIYAIYYRDGQWSQPERITNNNTEDINPKAAYINGDLLMVWLQDDEIVYTRDNVNTTPVTVSGTEDSSKQNFMITTDAEDRIALIYSDHTGQGTDIHAVFYDADDDIWSREVRMTDNNVISNPLSAAVTGGGDIKVGYTILEKTNIVLDGEEFVSFGDTNLMMATLRPRHDIAVFDEDITMSQENPVYGSTVTIEAVVHNRGEFSARGIEIEFYDGDPDSGGIKIGETITIANIIEARGSTTVSTQWTLPQSNGQHTIYVVADPHMKAYDYDRTNNIASITAVAPDLEITDIDYYPVNSSGYLVTVDVANIGGIDIDGTSIVTLYGSKTGMTISAEEMGSIKSGEQTQVFFMLDANELDFKDGQYMITAYIRAPFGITEYTEENNSKDIVIYKTQLSVAGYSPAQNSTESSIDGNTIILFNMNIHQGHDYADIRLYDENNISVIISKTIDNDRLIITGANPLEYDKNYVLVIGKNSLLGNNDTYIDDDFILAFKTKTEVPVEVTGVTILSAITTVQRGGSLQLNTKVMPENAANKNVAYTSDNSNVATVDNNGLVRGISVGSADITVTTEDVGYTDTIRITVTEVQIPSEKIVLSISEDGRVLTASFMAAYAAVDLNSGFTSVIIDDGITAELLSKIEEHKDKKIIVEILTSLTSARQLTHVQIPAGLLEKLTGIDDCVIKISTPVASVTFDNKALNSLASTGENIKLHINKIDKSSLDAKLQDKIGNRPVYDFTIKANDKTIVDFDGGYVYISIPYTIAGDEDNDSIVIYHIDSDGLLKTLRGRYNEQTKTADFRTQHFSLFALGYNKIEFLDVSQGSWYYDAVSFLAARSIVQGVGQNRFEPQANITRADFLVMVMNTYGIVPDLNIEDNFQDAGNTYYTPYLATAKSLGLVMGVGGNRYLPADNITRQDMMVILYRILTELDEIPVSESDNLLKDFKDSTQISDYAHTAFKLFVETGIIQGDGINLYPRTNLTRAQAARVLYNLIYE